MQTLLALEDKDGWGDNSWLTAADMAGGERFDQIEEVTNLFDAVVCIRLSCTRDVVNLRGDARLRMSVEMPMPSNFSASYCGYRILLGFGQGCWVQETMRKMVGYWRLKSHPRWVSADSLEGRKGCGDGKSRNSMPKGKTGLMKGRGRRQGFN